jgi:tripartite-type tricarboxylate transporter receptor subunit TctC
MTLARRRLLQLGACVAALPAASHIAAAQAYPSRPITMIVPTAAGGPLDVVGRIIGERMQRLLGQPVIIENVTGADGSIGTGRVARARPDGYTIDIGYMSTHVLNGAFYALSYDVSNDFAPIAALEKTGYIVVARKSLPATDLRELIAWLKANPNKASVGVVSAGIRLLAAVFQKETGTQFTVIPYRGIAPAMQDLAAGQVDLLIDTPRISVPLVRAGSIKAYAVTSDRRWIAAPDIPTFAEMGLPALSYSEWVGLFAPAGTPAEIIGRLNGAAIDALADPAVRSRILVSGVEIFPREQQTPEALAAMQKADTVKWWPIIKAAGIRAE